ncbi:MAG: 4-(cytidine 5'-diphospho)-2-C-methyl-D-erythritol kinase, partial [Verrucomicrobiales bacterium]
MIVRAPAKINLSLRVLGKRDDGFHALETLVLPLPDLADTLHFEKAAEFSLQCEQEGVPTDESNLVSRALRLFEKNTGLHCPWRIQLEKKIPHGAGLGGGSSDAASTFLALNELHETHLSLETLATWAAELGSDIPLFLYESVCRCTGRGEIIEPVDLTWPHPLLLVKPAFDIPTPWAYQQWRESRELPGISYAPQDVDGLSLENDLE